MTKRSMPTRFLRRLLNLTVGSPWLLLVLFLGLITVEVVANLIYDVVTDWQHVTGTSILGAGLTVVFLLGIAYCLYRWDRRQWPPQVEVTFDEKLVAPSHRGLILFLSPGGIDLPLFVIQHHYSGSQEQRLQHCWVLLTRHRDVEDVLEQLAARLSELEIDVAVHPVYLPSTDIESAYRAVERVYAHDVVAEGLEPAEVMADMTGGLKTMTAGMVLACLPFDRTLEYVESDRDADGRPIEGTQRAVVVDIDFFPAARRDEEGVPLERAGED